MNDAIIKLISSSTDYVNDVGRAIPKEVIKTVFAKKLDIRQSEFYQAQATDLRPELMFKIRSIEYNKEKIVEYDNQRYNIIRTYGPGEFTELVCQGLVNDNAST